jgi:hypothetical protein
MGTHANPPSGDFDARLQFLLQSSESLHANLQELHARNTEQDEKIREVEVLLNARTERLLTGIESLLIIVRSHQDRLDKLDGGKQ